MRFRNTGQIKSVAYSTKNPKLRDGLEIYCVAYEKKGCIAGVYVLKYFNYSKTNLL